MDKRNNKNSESENDRLNLIRDDNVCELTHVMYLMHKSFSVQIDLNKLTDE